MKLCFPVKRNLMDESEIYGHFGSAPLFILVETDTNRMTVVDNADKEHLHGNCNPVRALGGQEVDGVVVGGIGGVALSRLTREGITVYKASAGTVRENLELFIQGRLNMFQPGMVCPGYGGECSH